MEKLIQELISLPGACGQEHAVIKYLYERLKDQTDTCYVNGLGDLIVTKKGAFDGPVLAVSAHTDEVGFIVKKIETSGLIRFEKLGGHDDRILLSQKVLVHGEKGPCPGVIGTISAHMQRFDNTSLIRNYREMYIDIGAADDQEVREMGVSEGDQITWNSPFTRCGKSRAYGHAFDDRCGCAVLVKAIENIDFSKVHGTLIGIFSTQEEVGLRGATAAASSIRPDVALAVDTTAVSDTPEAMMDKTLALGKGAGIKIMDFSLLASKAVWKFMRKIAEENNIPYQLEIFTGIGTDAGALHQGYDGVPSGVISIPSRYAHSNVEMIDMNDFENCEKLLEAFLLNMRDSSQFAFLADC
ncbi:MAG: M42 family metallopeptidase [Solobacterium sp.]|nr:M42 family metallopeptidase [Solobacterium sp.]